MIDVTDFDGNRITFELPKMLPLTIHCNYLIVINISENFIVCFPDYLFPTAPRILETPRAHVRAHAHAYVFNYAASVMEPWRIAIWVLCRNTTPGVNSGRRGDATLQNARASGRFFVWRLAWKKMPVQSSHQHSAPVYAKLTRCRCWPDSIGHDC